MVQQKIPALIVHQGAVHHSHRFVNQLAVQIEIPRNLLLTGARLAADHDRLAHGGQGLNFRVQRAHCAAQAVKAVGKQVLALAAVHRPQPCPVSVQRDARRHAVEKISLGLVCHKDLRRDTVQLVAFGVVKFQRTADGYLRQVGAQLLQQFRRRVGGAGIKDAAVLVQYDGAAILPLGNAPQQHDFPPLLIVPLADAQRLVNGSVEALHTRCNKKCVQPQLPCHGVGNHVTDDHAIAALLQALQGVRNLIGTMYGQDIQIIAQQAAQCVRWFGDAGEADNGVQACVILRQLHCAQHIIDRNIDVHHRQVRHFANQRRRAPAGDNAVIGIGRHPLHDGHTGIHVAGVGIQLDLRVRFGCALHRSAHTVIRGNTENANLALLHSSKTSVFIFETIITGYSTNCTTCVFLFETLCRIV